MNNKLLISVMVTLEIIPAVVSAAGIQVSPARLDFAVDAGGKAAQDIIVANPTADVQIFEIYADDFTDIVKPEVSSFTLEAGSRKTLAISVIPKNSKQNDLIKNGGKLSTNLSVIGKSLADNKFSVGTGVKIPLTITAGAAPPPKITTRQAALAIVVFAILLTIFVWRLSLRKKSSSGGV